MLHILFRLMRRSIYLTHEIDEKFGILCQGPVESELLSLMHLREKRLLRVAGSALRQWALMWAAC